jgi:uncharacterized protein YuzE
MTQMCDSCSSREAISSSLCGVCESERKSRWFYYRPFRYRRWLPLWHGSCEGNQCTVMVGTPLTGHIVVKRNRSMCFVYDRKADMGYVSILTRDDGVPSLQTELVAPGVFVDYVVDTGEVFGIEIYGRSNA